MENKDYITGGKETIRFTKSTERVDDPFLELRFSDKARTLLTTEEICAIGQVILKELMSYKKVREYLEEGL